MHIVGSHFSKTVLSCCAQFRCNADKKKSLVERLWTKLKLSIETKNTTTNCPKCTRNIKTKCHLGCDWLLLLLDMTSQPTNAHKCMKVYNKHHIPPTCFGRSCGHFQGCALKRTDKSKYFNSFILCNAPPCRWPYEWPKHVKGYGMYDVLSSTYVHLLVLLPYLIA